MTEYRFFCVKEVQGLGGHLYLPGEEWDPEADDNDLPGDSTCWQVRRVLQIRDDAEQRNLSFTPVGRATTNWNAGPPEPPPPGPVYGEYDLLRGEAPVDEKATRSAQLAHFERTRVFAPKLSAEAGLQRQLQYLKWADPPQYAEILRQHPELGPAVPEAPAAPPAMELKEVVPAPAADPAELEALLAEELEALQAGDEIRLSKVREQIAEHLR